MQVNTTTARDEHGTVEKCTEGPGNASLVVHKRTQQTVSLSSWDGVDKTERLLPMLCYDVWLDWSYKHVGCPLEGLKYRPSATS